MNFVGGMMDRRAANRQFEQMLGLTQGSLDFLGQYGLQDPNQLFQGTYNPLLQLGTGASQFGNDFLQQYLTGNRDMMQQYLNNIPGMMQGNISSMYADPYADTGRGFDNAINFASNNLAAAQSDPRYSNMFDYLAQFGQGNNPYSLGTTDVSNELLGNRGNTAYNMTGIQNAGNAQATGGFNPQNQGLFNAGNDLFASGGYNPALQQFSQFANTNMGSLLPGQTQRASQGDMLGANGQNAINALMQGGSTPFSQLLAQAQQGTGGSFNAPVAQQGIGQGQINAAFNQGLQSGYTPQNMQTFGQGSQGLQQLLNRNGDIDNINSAAMQAFSGNLPGGDAFGGALEGILGSLMAAGNGGFNISGGGGGGGASGASAGQMGPMDPTLQQYLNRGLELFNNDPLLSMDDMSAMARDSAATAARQRAEQVQRYAAARGGGGFLVNSGAQNQTFADFAEEMARAESEAVNQARLRRQELGLQQQMQGGALGLQASQADTGRQQVQASRDIASANNATQASVANSNAATAAAGQNLQAQIASAQMRQAALQAAAQTALGARGQNYDRSGQGLNALLQAQGLANDRGGIFAQTALGALNSADQRYGAGLSILPGLAANNTNQQLGLTNAGLQSQLGNRELDVQSMLGVLGAGSQYALGNRQIDSGNQQAVLSGALGASGLANDLYGTQLGANNQAMNILANLGLGSEGLVSGRIGQGIGAMGQAGQNANNNLNIFGQIGNQAEQSQLQRMGLGADMLNNGMGNQLNAFGMLGNGLGQQYGVSNNAANTLGGLLGQQGNIWGNMYGFDLNRQQLGQNAYNSAFQNALGLGNLGLGYTNMGANALSGLNSNVISNMNTGLGQYGGVASSFGRNMGQQVGMFPQVPQGQGGGGGMMGGIMGGLGSIFGGGQSTYTGGMYNPSGSAGQWMGQFPGFNSPTPSAPFPVGQISVPGWNGSPGYRGNGF
jgi:hypothetical protein